MHRILIVCFIASLFQASILEANQTSTRSVMTNVCMINNQSCHALGTVTLYSSTDSTTASIPSTGTYYASITGVVSAIRINGQILCAPNAGDVQLPSSSEVTVSWPSSNVITITNDDETSSPVRE